MPSTRSFPDIGENAQLWPEVKTAYITLLLNHLQAECAETFYNSVVCRVLHRNYYNNENIFWRPAISTEHLHGPSPSYHSCYPPSQGLRRCLLKTVTGFGLSNRFQNLRRDIRRLEIAITEAPWQIMEGSTQLPDPGTQCPVFPQQGGLYRLPYHQWRPYTGPGHPAASGS